MKGKIMSKLKDFIENNKSIHQKYAFSPYSIKNLSIDSGIPYATLMDYLHDKIALNNMPISRFKKIATLYNVSLDHLYKCLF